jgi:hypothetical protein
VGDRRGGRAEHRCSPEELWSLLHHSRNLAIDKTGSSVYLDIDKIDSAGGQQ